MKKNGLKVIVGLSLTICSLFLLFINVEPASGKQNEQINQFFSQDFGFSFPIPDSYELASEVNSGLNIVYTFSDDNNKFEIVVANSGAGIEGKNLKAWVLKNQPEWIGEIIDYQWLTIDGVSTYHIKAKYEELNTTAYISLFQDKIYTIQLYGWDSDMDQLEKKLVDNWRWNKGQKTKSVEERISNESINDSLNEASTIQPMAAPTLQFPFCDTWRISGDYYTQSHVGQYNEWALDWVKSTGATTGQPVYSAHQGRVYGASWDSTGGGNMMKIRYDADTTYTTYYLHLNDFVLGVSNTVYPPGTLIAHAGGTGNVSGPHLHFAYLRNATSILPEPMSGHTGFKYPNEYTRYCGPSIPGAPGGVSATDGTYTDRVVVSWNGVDTATSYQVFRATSSGGTRTHISTPTGTNFTDTSATPGSTFWYWVKACNSAGCSGYSAGDSGYASLPVPGTPSGVQASDGTYTSHVHISWTSVSYATSYQVFRAESSTGSKTQIGTPTGLEYSDMSAAQGVTYWYWVKACNSSGCSNFSSGDSGYARLPIPVAPTSVSATDGLYTDRIQISWGLADKATNYQVFRAESATGGKTQIGDSTTQVFWDMDVEQGTTYWYWLKACNASGCSDFSPYDTGYALLPIPSTPNGLTATDGTYTDRVQVTWLNAPVASSYMLYRAESVSGTKSLVASLPTNSYDDLDVIQGVSYWYWVKACNSSGCSDFSQSDIGYALLPIPSIPTNVSASDGLFSDYVKIDWAIVTTASNYQIFRSDSISGTKTQLANITSNNYNDSNVVQGINYYYWIKACNSSGCSDFSQSDIGYALLPIPSAPTIVSASDGLFTDRIQITWQSTFSATNYQLYRSDTASGIKTQIGNQASTLFNDLNVIQGNNYWYWVKACNLSGCSDFSQSDIGYALLPIPNAPSSISASDGTFTDRVQIDWSIAPGADNYQLFRSDTINGPKTQVATPASNSYVDYSVQQGTIYWYWIKACNGSGCSEFSVADSGYALIPIPSIPVGLNATDGTFSDRVQLSWQENSVTEEFNIYRSTNVNGTRSLIGTSQSNSYTDTNAVINVTYWYWIKACNQTGCSDFSTSDSGFAAYQTPEAPVSVEATDGTYSDKVDVSWSTVPTAASYNVYRASSEQGNRGLIASVTSETYSDETAIVNQTYWYWIKACNSSGCSEFSESDSGYAAYPIPSIPQNVQASDGIYRDHISVSWDQVSDASQYQLYRAESEVSNPEMIAELATIQFQDYNATKGKVYWYWIKACNTTGCSNLSMSDSGFTLLDLPTTPGNLKASDGTYTDKIVLTWNSVSSAESYEVYRAISAFGVKQMIGTSTENSYQDYGVDSNTLYWYWVKACNLSGTSQFSNSDSGFRSNREHKNFLPIVRVK